MRERNNCRSSGCPLHPSTKFLRSRSGWKGATEPSVFAGCVDRGWVFRYVTIGVAGNPIARRRPLAASYPMADTLSVVCVRLRAGKHTRPCASRTQTRGMDNRTLAHTVARGKDDESVLGHLYALTVDRTLPVTRPAHRGSRPEALDRGFPFPVKDTTYPDYSLLGGSVFPVSG